MKTQRTLEILLAGIVLMLVNACATYPRSGQAALAGTWTNSLGTVWTCRADGTFDVDLNRDGKRDAWGTVTVSGNTATIQRTGGINPKGCNGPRRHMDQFARHRLDDQLRQHLPRRRC